MGNFLLSWNLPEWFCLWFYYATDQTAVPQSNNDIRLKDMNEQNLTSMAQDLNNWMPMAELPKHYNQFSYATLKTMFWKRAERPGLERCSQMVGKKLFVNVPMFGLWLAGQLPEQRGE